MCSGGPSRRLVSLGCVAGSTLVLHSAAAQAATVPVPSQYTTIQAGIDAALAGDQVVATDGWNAAVGNKKFQYTAGSTSCKICANDVEPASGLFDRCA